MQNGFLIFAEVDDDKHWLIVSCLEKMLIKYASYLRTSNKKLDARYIT